MKKLFTFAAALLATMTMFAAVTVPTGVLNPIDVPADNWSNKAAPLYVVEGDWVTFLPYEIYSSKQTWTASDATGSTSGSWAATTPIPASTNWTGDVKAASLRDNNGGSNQKGAYYYRVTNTTDVAALVKSGSDKKRTIALEAYELTEGVVSETAVKSVTMEANSDAVITISELDKFKEYVIVVRQIVGGSGGTSEGNSTFYAISFKTVFTASTPVTSVTLDGAETAYIGTATTITATTDVPADEYKWFVDGAEQQGETAKTFNFTPTEAKTYAITCQARNEYNNDAWVASAALNITAQKLCGELINATLTSGTAAEVIGVIGGKASVSLSSSKKLDKGKYFGITLATGTFKTGDMVNINVTTAAGMGKVAVYADQQMTTPLYVGEDYGVAGDNEFMLPKEATGLTSLWIARDANDEINSWNPVLNYISVTRDCDESAKLSVSPTEVTLNATAAEPTVSATVTISGKNLTPNTYNFTMPQVAGLTINPASVTVDGDGFLSETVTISYTSEANVAATSTTIDLSIGSLTEHITVNYSADMVRNYATSLNIEQLVLDNGKGYDISGAFAEHNLDAGFTFDNNNALDSLDDADGKTARNYAFMGLKLKTSGATIGLWLKQGSTLNVRLGNMGANVKVSGAGEEETLTADDYANIDNDADNKVYTYTAADADAYILFTTTGSGTIVFKQIMIDDDIAAVTLPAKPGTGTALDNIEALDLNAPMYNVLGQKVGADYKGIVLQNGKKFMLK